MPRDISGRRLQLENDGHDVFFSQKSRPFFFSPFFVQAKAKDDLLITNDVDAEWDWYIYLFLTNQFLLGSVGKIYHTLSIWDCVPLQILLLLVRAVCHCAPFAFILCQPTKGSRKPYICRRVVFACIGKYVCVFFQSYTSEVKIINTTAEKSKHEDPRSTTMYGLFAYIFDPLNYLKIVTNRLNRPYGTEVWMFKKEPWRLNFGCLRLDVPLLEVRIQT